MQGKPPPAQPVGQEGLKQAPSQPGSPLLDPLLSAQSPKQERINTALSNNSPGRDAAV